MTKIFLSLGLILGFLAKNSEGFCAHGWGGIGEYHKECPDSADFEACYARCNCWTDFPDMGGQITHEVDALCMMDACWCSYNQDLCPYGTLKTNPYCSSRGWSSECSYNQDLCPYGTLKTNPYCCTKVGITCDDVVC